MGPACWFSAVVFSAVCVLLMVRDRGGTLKFLAEQHRGSNDTVCHVRLKSWSRLSWMLTSVNLGWSQVLALVHIQPPWSSTWAVRVHLSQATPFSWGSFLAHSASQSPQFTLGLRETYACPHDTLRSCLASLSSSQDRFGEFLFCAAVGNQDISLCFT